MNAAIPAATLILFRDGPDGPEHLFVERAASMVFAAGAVVFPGGRVDPGDSQLAERFPALDAEDAAARIAAIRETLEETGLVLGIAGGDASALRTGLSTGADFAALLDAAGARLELDALHPFARWLPKKHERRVFDTRFYAARVPDAAAVATVDATENVRLFWSTARGVLEGADAGRVKIIFPTRRNLERLATLPSLDDLRTHVAQHPIEPITPWVEERDGAPHICIPTGRGYPVCAQLVATVERG